MLSTLFALSLDAQAGALGLGLAAGSPSGVTLKWYNGTGDALDFLVGSTWNNGWDRGGLVVSGDYLFGLGTLVNGSNADLDLYLGPGVNVWFNNYGYNYGNYGYGFLAVEMPIGLSLTLQQAPIEIFFEVAPMAVILSNFGFAVGGAVGARYYF